MNLDPDKSDSLVPRGNAQTSPPGETGAGHNLGEQVQYSGFHHLDLTIGQFAANPQFSGEFRNSRNNTV